MLSGLAFAVEPKFNENFKQTKNKIETSSPGKIEVIELFWYGCIHCYTMDPYLDKWAEALPDDVVFNSCLLYTSPSPRDVEESRMPSSA